MRIAFLSFYSGQIDRGVEVATTALAQGLGKHHDVTVFQAGKRVSSDVQTVILPVIDTWPTDTSNSPGRPLYLDFYSRKIAWFTFTFLPHFFRHQFEVVIPTNGGWQVLVIRLLTWLTGKKMVVAGNAGIGRDDLWQLLCWPNHYVAISPQGFRWAKQFLPWIKKSYIPYGVDINKLQKAKPVNLELAKPIVLCVAAFLPYKRIKLLIEAMQLVPEASLLVIGQGPLEGELRRLGQTLGDRFLLLTEVTHEKLVSFYKSATVFSLPSAESEAFGIVYVEALAAGLTVVAPDDFNRREILGEAGVYVDPRDKSDYAAKLRAALAEPRREQALSQAKKYEWSQIVAQYEELLKTL